MENKRVLFKDGIIPQDKQSVKIGQQINNLTVISEPYLKYEYGSYRQFTKVNCVCGNIKEVKCAVFNQGRYINCSKSCKQSPQNKNLKKCTKCKQYKELNKFGKNRSKKDGLSTECLECKHIYKLVKYNLTYDEYTAILRKQNDACAICEKQPETNIYLSVDHNHKTGKVRGLLCHNCNVAIGFLNDNISIAHKAILYLEENNETF